MKRIPLGAEPIATIDLGDPAPAELHAIDGLVVLLRRDFTLIEDCVSVTYRTVRVDRKPADTALLAREVDAAGHRPDRAAAERAAALVALGVKPLMRLHSIRDGLARIEFLDSDGDWGVSTLMTVDQVRDYANGALTMSELRDDPVERDRLLATSISMDHAAAVLAAAS